MAFIAKLKMDQFEQRHVDNGRDTKGQNGNIDI